jgi:hypothetical protein
LSTSNIRRQAEEYLHELLDLLALQSQAEGEVTTLVGLGADQGIDCRLENLLRGLVGDLFDLNTALGRGHEHDAPARAVHDGAEVQLVGDIRAGLDENLRHGLSVRIGLVGDQPRPSQCEAKSSISSCLTSLTPPALPRPPACTWALTTHMSPPIEVRGFHRLVRRINCMPPGDRQTVLGEQLLALILVKIHGVFRLGSDLRFRAHKRRAAR